MKKNPEEIQEEKRSKKAFAWLIKMSRRKNALVSVEGWHEEKSISKKERDQLYNSNRRLFDVEAIVKQKNFFEKSI